MPVWTSAHPPADYPAETLTTRLAGPISVDPASFLREQLESASPDRLRDMVKTFADALISAEADALCGAPYGVRSDERTNSRNGYRARDWDTRAGTVELAIPKLRAAASDCDSSRAVHVRVGEVRGSADQQKTITRWRSPIDGDLGPYGSEPC